MYQETMGTVTAVAKQWWLKVNTKSFRVSPLDGATFPHVITVTYSVDGKTYTKRKWLNAGASVPQVGSQQTILYWTEKPAKAKIL